MTPLSEDIKAPMELENNYVVMYGKALTFKDEGLVNYRRQEDEQYIMGCKFCLNRKLLTNRWMMCVIPKFVPQMYNMKVMMAMECLPVYSGCGSAVEKTYFSNRTPWTGPILTPGI